MEIVKISPKYQIVIPKRVRSLFQLRPGQNIQVMAYGDRIELIPERTLTEMRGFLKGMDASVEREVNQL
ncbi:MAG: AbrB/MazE/SpoVT family DNA-binding domain-containing protein [Coprothermobacterota bacterium]|nr:AbrB/MazE/SpoVT family DNA-binding domain-containing protein [Coprothermobacterota bacterium]